MYVKGGGYSLSRGDIPALGLKGLRKTTKDLRVVGVPAETRTWNLRTQIRKVSD